MTPPTSADCPASRVSHFGVDAAQLRDRPYFATENPDASTRSPHPVPEAMRRERCAPNDELGSGGPATCQSMPTAHLARADCAPSRVPQAPIDTQSAANATPPHRAP